LTDEELSDVVIFLQEQHKHQMDNQPGLNDSLDALDDNKEEKDG